MRREVKGEREGGEGRNEWGRVKCGQAGRLGLQTEARASIGSRGGVCACVGAWVCERV